ncbi:hypothetical protein QVD17_25852 [Tagetes erecta]|uniref:Uncharacterized protein n=1 Tax=Tagetes erecta TaxID=13708 RepID=A0AAD8K869_TARER|nr:hypothetical protein QVD17_25852 [Tagetes erecta]
METFGQSKQMSRLMSPRQRVTKLTLSLPCLMERCGNHGDYVHENKREPVWGMELVPDKGFITLTYCFIYLVLSLVENLSAHGLSPTSWLRRLRCLRCLRHTHVAQSFACMANELARS